MTNVQFVSKYYNYDDFETYENYNCSPVDVYYYYIQYNKYLYIGFIKTYYDSQTGAAIESEKMNCHIFENMTTGHLKKYNIDIDNAPIQLTINISDFEYLYNKYK